MDTGTEATPNGEPQTPASGVPGAPDAGAPDSLTAPEGEPAAGAEADEREAPAGAEAEGERGAEPEEPAAAVRAGEESGTQPAEAAGVLAGGVITLDENAHEPAESPVEPAQPATPAEQPAEEDEDRRTRRLLLLLLGTLGVAAVFLIVLLIWLLRPHPAEEAGPGTAGKAAGGYPIRVVRSIYGYGSAAGERLVFPLGVAFGEEGTVWVSDTGNSRLLVFDASGRLLQTVGAQSGPSRLQSPYGIAVDAERHRVYVADWTAAAVRIFSSTGRYIDSLPSPAQSLKVFGSTGFSPYDVRLLNGRLIVSSNDGLYFFDANGRVAARWGGKKGRGQAIGEFNFPDAFDVDAKSGRIYVADSLNRRVVALDVDGRVLWISGKPDKAGKTTGFWQLPRGVVVAPDGNVYVVDTFRFDSKGVGVGHIVVLSRDGALLSEFGRAGTQNDAFNFPEKLAARSDGMFAIADRESNRILLFTLGGLPRPKATEADAYKLSFLAPKDARVAIGG